jgi:hypothetical protein
MCPGVDSASKNEYQDTPGGKDDLHSAESRENPVALTYRILQGPAQACSGKTIPLPLSCIKQMMMMMMMMMMMI